MGFTATGKAAACAAAAAALLCLACSCTGAGGFAEDQGSPARGNDVSWVREDTAGDADADGAGPGGPPEGEAAEDAPEPAGQADLGATDATSELNSSQTAFDTSRAWPLSRTGEVSALVGEDVASRLLDDLNAYFEPAGLSVDDAVDVMVAEDGVERTGKLVRFRVMAYHGADRIVVDCAYDAASGEHAFARQP